MFLDSPNTKANQTPEFSFLRGGQMEMSLVINLAHDKRMSIAYSIYRFLYEKGNLPDESTLFELIKMSKTPNEMYRNINHQFLLHMKEALLNAVSPHNRDKFSQLIKIEEHISKGLSNDDKFTILFQSHVMTDPDSDVLRGFYNTLKQIDRDIINNNIDPNLTFSIYVKPHIFNEVKEILAQEVCMPIMNNTYSHMMLVKLEYLNDLAETHENIQENLEQFWRAVSKDNPKITELQKYKPDFLIIYAVDHKQIF